MKKQGNQNHYQANELSPITTELVSIVKKTFGVTEVLKSAIQPIVSQLERAFIYGSIAKGSEHSASDIDVMIVGKDLSYSEIMQLFEKVELELNRTINPTIYTPEDFSKRLKEGNNFLTKVMTNETINLIDSDTN